MPVWPFLSRSIRHRTFGRLKSVRNGKYWHARVAVAQVSKPVELHISADKSGPSAAQEGLFLRLASQYPAVFNTALQAVHREYQRVRLNQPQLKWPAAEELADLEYLTPLDRIWLDDHGGRQFVFTFNHRSDKEHSFHVFFDGDRVKSVASERE
jgi:hypothetical protein